MSSARNLGTRYPRHWTRISQYVVPNEFLQMVPIWLVSCERPILAHFPCPRWNGSTDAEAPASNVASAQQSSASTFWFSHSPEIHVFTLTCWPNVSPRYPAISWNWSTRHAIHRVLYFPMKSNNTVKEGLDSTVKGLIAIWDDVNGNWIHLLCLLKLVTTDNDSQHSAGSNFNKRGTCDNAVLASGGARRRIIGVPIYERGA